MYCLAEIFKSCGVCSFNYNRRIWKKIYKGICLIFGYTYGSNLGLETQLIIANRVKLSTDTEFSQAEAECLLVEISKMLDTMIFKFRRNTKR